MQKYTYKHPNAIDTTTVIAVYNDTGEITHSFQRYYSNRLKKLLDKAMDYRYFLYYNVFDVEETLVFTCKKISKKGRVYYEAIDHLQENKFIVAYDKWKELIPDLTITDGHIHIQLHKEMENWSRFTHNEKEIARWRAEIGDQFTIFLEIEEDSPIQNVAFFIAISQCALFIGG
ncbi:hypothetical protein WAX74_13585 [Psychrobacillus sp. FJAT-51614]|uniref:Tubby C-terminal domain-containing protein n=1 Tax=Psychrobacillus mangrovi TaxID=3117745 RepID=A0ABU8F6M5_9BACI